MTCRHLIAQGAFSKFLHFLVGPNAENVSCKLLPLLFSGHPTLGKTLGYTGPGRWKLVLRQERHRLGYKGIGWQVKVCNKGQTPVFTRKFSEDVRECLSGLEAIFGDFREVVGSLLKIVKNVVISLFI